MSHSNVWVVLCNCPDETSARQLANGLIETRLAACVNLLPPVTSFYRWDDRIENTTEVPLLIKTTEAHYPALQSWLANAHPYDVPEIIALPVAAGLPPYLAWVTSETAARP